MGEKLLRRQRDNTADQEGDSDDRNQRQDWQEFLNELASEMIDQKSGNHRAKYHHRNGFHHSDEGNIDPSAREHPSQERRHQRRQKRRRHRHSDRQGDVALREIGNHIRRSTARTGANQHDADSDIRRQRKDLDQRPGNQRHQCELRQRADTDFPRPLRKHMEILKFQGHAHAEHHDAEHPWYMRADPLKRRRNRRAQNRDQDNQDCHVVHDKTAKLFHQNPSISDPKEHGYIKSAFRQRPKGAESFCAKSPSVSVERSKQTFPKLTANL